MVWCGWVGEWFFFGGGGVASLRSHVVQGRRSRALQQDNKNMQQDNKKPAPAAAARCPAAGAGYIPFQALSHLLCVTCLGRLGYQCNYMLSPLFWHWRRRAAGEGTSTLCANVRHGARCTVQGGQRQPTRHQKAPCKDWAPLRCEPAAPGLPHPPCQAHSWCSTSSERPAWPGPRAHAAGCSYDTWQG